MTEIEHQPPTIQDTAAPDSKPSIRRVADEAKTSQQRNLSRVRAVLDTAPSSRRSAYGIFSFNSIVPCANCSASYDF